MPSTGTKLKGGKLAGKVGAKAGQKLAPHAGKAALKLGKAELKLLRAATRRREPRSARYLKYGIFLAIGLALGALIKNAKKPGGPKHHTPPKPPKAPEREPNIGTHGGGIVSSTVVPEQQEDVEQKIRSALGQDDRTKDIPKPNVTVTAGVAELRGPVPSESAKAAAEEITKNIEGVSEVKNLLVVA